MLDDKGRTIEGVYRIDPDGKVARVIGREVERANGVLVSPDDRYLFVADNNNNNVGGARKLWRFDLRRTALSTSPARNCSTTGARAVGRTASSRTARAGSTSPPG